MRFTLNLGIGGYQDYVAVAKAADESGWTSIGVPDSLFFPKETESEYPYADTQKVRQAIGQEPFIDPIVAMSWMAAVTQRVRFYPAVLKVPVRQPLVLAKALGSLAVMSGNRIALGAGLSPWKEDFTYNGVPFEPRGRIMDDCIAIIRGALSGEFFEFHSEHFDIGPMKITPVPDQPLPILIGGHSKPALARAARLGDGWISANADRRAIKGMIGQLNALRAEHGTLERTDYEIHVSDVTAQRLDDFRELAGIGVTDAGVTPWNMYDASLDLQTKLDRIRRFGDAVIAKF